MASKNKNKNSKLERKMGLGALIGLGVGATVGSGIFSTISEVALLVSFSYLFNVIVIDNHFNWDLIINTVSNFHVMFGHILYALTLSVTVIVVAVPEDWFIL